MPELHSYVVIGAGAAGVAAARKLGRTAGPGRVLLVSEEDGLPYERPTLSKEALKSPDAAIPHICSRDEFEQLGVDYRSGVRVSRIARAERLLGTDAGDIRYEKLLIATGSLPRRLEIEGEQLSGVHYLRHAADAIALRKVLAPHSRIVVVGGGFIGLEVAATARGLGCVVTLLTRDRHLMRRCLPALVAEQVASMLQDQGLDIRLNSEPYRLEGEARVEGVRLGSGESIPADAVLVGIGSRPNDALASEAGLAVDDGILVDSRWRTSDEHIFAVGDVARRSPDNAGPNSRGVRLESWEPAIEHGQLAARAMLGEDVEEPSPPWMWSDQHDVNIQIVGNPHPDDPAILRSLPEERRLFAAFLEDDRLTGAITVNDGPSMTLLRRAVNEGRPIDPRLLEDPRVSLREALGYARRVRSA